MNDSGSLSQDLESAHRDNDKNALLKIKRGLFDLQPQSPDDVKELYRSAVFLLLEAHDSDLPFVLLHRLSSSKIQCPELVESFITYAQCLKRQGKDDQALFQLRKAVSLSASFPQSALNAYDYLCAYLNEDNSHYKEYQKCLDEKEALLTGLIKDDTELGERVALMVRHIQLLRERGSDGDIPRADEIQKSIKELGFEKELNPLKESE